MIVIHRYSYDSHAYRVDSQGSGLASRLLLAFTLNPSAEAAMQLHLRLDLDLLAGAQQALLWANTVLY